MPAALPEELRLYQFAIKRRACANGASGDKKFGLKSVGHFCWNFGAPPKPIRRGEAIGAGMPLFRGSQPRLFG
jgi:hypothetical protein